MRATEYATRPCQHSSAALSRSRPADDGLQFLPLLRRAVRGVSGDGDAPRFSATAISTISPISAMAAAPATPTASSRRRTNSTSTCRRRWRIVRGDSYAAYAWPRVLRGLFARNGLAISIIAALSVAAFIIGFVAAAAIRRCCSASTPGRARSTS